MRSERLMSRVKTAMSGYTLPACCRQPVNGYRDRSLEDFVMCSERLIQLLCVLAFVGLLAWSPAAATANVLYSQDFSSAPNLNSGNWHDQIPYTGDPGDFPPAGTIGTWDTSSGAAVPNTSGGNLVCASNAQYMFSAGDKAAFGSLYDSTTGRIGGGNVSGTVYVRFDMTSNWANQGNSYGNLQLTQGSLSTVDDLNANQGMSAGKAWGSNAFSWMIQSLGSKGDLNSANPDPGRTYQYDPLGNTSTFVVKLTFNGTGNDVATMFLNPTVAPESQQPRL